MNKDEKIEVGVDWVPHLIIPSGADLDKGLKIKKRNFNQDAGVRSFPRALTILSFQIQTF